jgi:hypothetical protein
MVPMREPTLFFERTTDRRLENHDGDPPAGVMLLSML